MTFIAESFRNRPALWALATLVSVVLLAGVISQVDGAQLRGMIANASWTALGTAVALLVLEGVFTALRIRMFAPGPPPLGAALKANAWYVLFLVMLPARLGEVAAVFVFRTTLGQSFGGAGMSVIVQRLYDVIVLGTLFLLALTGLSGLFDTSIMALAALAVIAASVALALHMDTALTLLAAVLGKAFGPRAKARRLAIEARRYVRHDLDRGDIPLVLVLTAGKWVSNLAALMLLLAATGLSLSLAQAAVVAGAYNFLAIIPLQTIGGLGVGEAGLALLLAGMGVGTSMAAAASLMVRSVLILFPFVFWALVMTGLRGWQPR